MALLTDFSPIQKTLEHAPVQVSFAIAAFNCADTLSETLDSLLDQSYPFWEAIIVTDGAKDATAQVAAKYAANDNRFRVLSKPRAGLSVARNAAVNEAQYDWIACLDGGDLVLPDYLEQMTAAISEDASVDAVCCEFARYYEIDGAKIAQPLLFEPNDFFLAAAQTRPIGSNAIVVRKSLVIENGMFDPKLQVCSDWDLWQRIARTGFQLHQIHEPLALERMRSDSQASSGLAFLTEAIAIVDRGHNADPRVPYPAAQFAAGVSPTGLDTRKIIMACSAAGMILGAGGDAIGVFNELVGVKPSGLDPEAVANAIYDAALLPTASEPQGWQDLMPKISDNVQRIPESA